jgi:hypothetical protein
MDTGARRSTPAERAPLLPRTRSHATVRKSSVVDEVEHIIEEAVGIVDRPVVQLALHLSYPPCRPIGIGP